MRLNQVKRTGDKVNVNNVEYEAYDKSEHNVCWKELKKCYEPIVNSTFCRYPQYIHKMLLDVDKVSFFLIYIVST